MDAAGLERAALQEENDKLRAALEAVRVEAAQEAGFREVRVINGRGTGFQKERVRQVVAKSALVEGYEEATPDRGGWGATVVKLKAR
mgnify:CR=1 FL=1